jgi:hypothetical protein
LETGRSHTTLRYAACAGSTTMNKEEDVWISS